MERWTVLTDMEQNEVWDRFFQEFAFRPSVRRIDWPSITTDREIHTFSISDLWGNGYDEGIYINFLQKAIDAFVDVTEPEELIYALDWQHECFYLDPRKLTPGLMIDYVTSSTVVSFIPDGDYYIFITKDFENIWFGHPWEKTVTVIGDRLIKAVKARQPFL
jgi:hypothetical protein